MNGLLHQGLRIPLFKCLILSPCKDGKQSYVVILLTTSRLPAISENKPPEGNRHRACTPRSSSIYWQRHQRYHLSSWNSPGADEQGSLVLPPEQKLSPLTHGGPSGIKVAEKTALCKWMRSSSAHVLHGNSSPRPCRLNAASGPNTEGGTAHKTCPSSRNTAPRSTGQRKPSGHGAGSPIATALEHQMTTSSQRQVRNLILCCWLLSCSFQHF